MINVDYLPTLLDMFKTGYEKFNTLREHFLPEFRHNFYKFVLDCYREKYLKSDSDLTWCLENYKRYNPQDPMAWVKDVEKTLNDKLIHCAYVYQLIADESINAREQFLYLLKHRLDLFLPLKIVQLFITQHKFCTDLLLMEIALKKTKDI